MAVKWWQYFPVQPGLALIEGQLKKKTKCVYRSVFVARLSIELVMDRLTAAHMSGKDQFSKPKQFALLN